MPPHYFVAAAILLSIIVITVFGHAPFYRIAESYRAWNATTWNRLMSRRRNAYYTMLRAKRNVYFACRDDAITNRCRAELSTYIAQSRTSVADEKPPLTDSEDYKLWQNVVEEMDQVLDILKTPISEDTPRDRRRWLKNLADDVLSEYRTYITKRRRHLDAIRRGDRLRRRVRRDAASNTQKGRQSQFLRRCDRGRCLSPAECKSNECVNFRCAPAPPELGRGTCMPPRSFLAADG